MKKYFIFFLIAVGILISPAFSRAAAIFDFTTSNAGQVSNPAGYSSVFALGHPSMDAATGTTLYFEVNGAYAGETCGDIGNSTRVWTLYEFADSGYSSYLNSADFAHRSHAGEWAIDNVIASTTDSEVATTTFSFAINTASYYLIASYCGSGSGVANTLASAGSYGSNGSGIASWFGSGVYPYSGTPFFFLGTTSPLPPSGPSLSFIYPSDGTTTPPFSPWVINADTLTSGHQYWIKINWTRINHGCGNNVLYGYQYCTIFGDTSVPWVASSTSAIVQVPRPDRDLGYAYDKYIDDEWTAAAYLYDNNASSTGFITSNGISFDMLRYFADYGGAIGAIGTTTYNYISVSPTGTIGINQGSNNFTSQVTGGVRIRNASSTSGCSPAADWTDIGGGVSYALCTAVNQLFTPSEVYSDDIRQSFTLLQGDFPFNFVYGTLGQISNAAIAAQNASGSLTLSIWSMDIPIANSSTLSRFVGTDNKNLIFQTQDAVAWVGVAWTALRIIF